MGRRDVLAGEFVKVHAALRGVKFESVAQVRFLFKRSDGSIAFSCDADVTERKVRANTYDGKVKPPDPKQDEIFYDVKSYLKVLGTPEQRFVEDLRVWRKQLTINAFDTADGSAAVDAHCKVTPGSDSAHPHTDDGGEVKIDIGFNESQTIEWQPPWNLVSWVKDTGPVRRVELEHRFKAKFVKLTPGATRNQWVLRDAALGADCGSKVKIQVAAQDGYGRPQDKVFIKAKTPGKPLFEDGKELGAGLVAEFEVDVGTKLVDTTTVEIGSTTACQDQKAFLKHTHFSAKFVFPAGPSHDQLVRKSANDGDHCGPKLKVRVGAVALARQGDKIYLQHKSPTGAVTKLDGTLQANLEASFEINLGTSSGDLWELDVGSTDACNNAKARVRTAAYRPKLQYPPSKANGYKQWVNLPVDANDPSKGNLVSVRVVSDLSGGLTAGQRGDKVFLKATFDGANCARTPDNDGHLPRTTHEVEGVLDDQGAATFALNVGHAGGDKIEIAIGMDQGCTDDKASLITWRKLF
jgi:hypothetical protein